MSASTKNSVCSLVFSLFLLTILSTGAGAQDGRDVVAKIGDYKLTLDEYEHQYIRNNGGEDAAANATAEDRKEFLELLIKYRLKVLEARDAGYDKDEEIEEELNEYRNSLAIPYLTERALVDPRIEKLYQRRLIEIRAAHILIRPLADTSGQTGDKDTLTAFNKALDVLRMARAGESWDSLAAKYSDDPGTAQKGGDLLYFTAGMTVPAFDVAAYATEPGEVYPHPVKTQFGYHLLKVTEKRTARGEIQVSHILVRIPQETPDDTSAAYAKISAILDTLNDGGDFAELSRRNSEDPNNGPNGGDLGWIGRKKLVPEFEVVAFELPVGGTSGIVKTNFGYHIIRVTGEKPPKSLEESRQELKELYRRYGYDADNEKFISDIVARHDRKVETDVVMEMIAVLDTTSTTSVAGWYNDIDEDLLAKTVVRLNTKTVTVGEAIRIIERDEDFQSQPLNRATLQNVMMLVGRKEALRLETADLEERYPEFKSLMNEYREGVLLFRAEQEAVWNNVKVEEEPLKAYWEQHRSEYTWPQRVRFSEIFITSDSLGQVLRDSLDNGADFGELAGRHTQRSGYKKKLGDWGFQPVDANDLTSRANGIEIGWTEGPLKFQYGFSIIKVTGKDQAREKTFEEAHSEVSSKFQEFESKRIEREWIARLKDKFGVEVFDDVFSRAFSSLGK